MIELALLLSCLSIGLFLVLLASIRFGFKSFSDGLDEAHQKIDFTRKENVVRRKHHMHRIKGIESRMEDILNDLEELKSMHPKKKKSKEQLANEEETEDELLEEVMN